MMLKAIFLAIYLIVDIAYVLISQKYYESYAKAIQGSGFSKKKDVLIFAILSYIFLGLAWWFLVAEHITPITPIWKAVFYAFILALAIYGVFNATLYVIFDKWDYRVVVRDTLWGISWLSILTIGYTFTLSRSIKDKGSL